MGLVANLLNASVVPGYWVPAVKIEREDSTMNRLRQSLPVNPAAFKREGGPSSFLPSTPAMRKPEVPSMGRRIKRQRTEDTHE